jgi:hypothetical protein
MQEQPPLHPAEGDGQVGTDRAVGGAAVVGGDAGGDVAGHDGRPVGVSPQQRLGRLSRRAARGPRHAGPEQRVDGDVAPRQGAIEVVDAGGRPPPAGAPTGAVRGGLAGYLDVHAIDGDHPGLRSQGGEAACGDPAVAAVVALADQDRDAQAVAAAGRRDHAAGEVAAGAFHQRRPGVAGVDGCRVAGAGRSRVQQRVGGAHSTVTVLARLRGWSTSSPRNTATW